jgi:hypothetical protein
MRAGQRIDQLPGDAHLRSRLAHRAFQNIAHAELAPDLLHVDGAALVGEGRITGDDKEPADLRQRGDDLLDHAVGEIFLFRVAADIGERQYRNRRLLGERQWLRRRCSWFRAQSHAPNMHWPGNVLDVLLAHILEGDIELVAHLVVHHAADADPAGFGERLQPRRDVDPVAKDVAAVADHVAEIDPDTEFDALLLRDFGVALGHCPLHFDRAAHSVNNARKLDQQPVAGGLDDATVVLLDLGIGQFTPQRFEAFERAFFVHPHQSRIARDIGGQDRSKTSGYGHS